MESYDWVRGTNVTAAIDNTKKNQDALSYARSIMTDEQFAVLHKAYKQLWRFQIAPMGIMLIVLIILNFVFPEQRLVIWVFGAAFAILFFSLILIISQFFVGKPWHQYMKLLRNGESKESIILHLFGLNDEQFEKLLRPYNKQYADMFGAVPYRQNYECSDMQYYDALIKAIDTKTELHRLLKLKKT